MNIKFTPQQINFLIENYPSKGLRYCESILELPSTTILNKIRKLKLKLNKNLRKETAKTGKLTLRNDKLSMFDNTFTDIQIYALGLLWADGCLYKYPRRNAKSLLFKVCSDDYSDFREAIHSLGKISERKIKTGYKEQTNAFINNYGLINWLYSINFQNKSHTTANVLLSNIPKNQHNCFFQGWSDGDGCFYYKEKPKCRQYTVTGPYDYDWSDWIFLLSSLDCDYKLEEKKNDTGRSSRIAIYKKESIQKLVNYLYQSNIPKLQRKYNKAQLCCI